MTKEKIFSAGGQAVVEGVLMRSQHRLAVAVRKPNGKITIKKEKIVSIADRFTFLRWPFIRGVFNLFQMLFIGFKALIHSANESMDKIEDELTFMEIVFSIVLAIGFALLIFKALPFFVAVLFERMFSFVKNNYIVFNIIDGVAKISFFILYILIISLMRDVKRIFEYHGAEHKTVNCYEDGKKLTPCNVMKHSPLHPRCGTNFVLIVLMLSIIVYTFIPKGFDLWARFGLRLVLLPVIAGISYEILKLCGKYSNNPVMKLVALPGLAVQMITTREPDKKQVEVAIAALKGVIKSR